MKIFVHKIIEAKEIHHGHWYDEDDEFCLWLNYVIYSNEECIIPDKIKEMIIKEFELDSNKEWDNYRSFPVNTPKLYYLSSNPKYMMHEEIDISLSNKIIDIFKGSDVDVEVLSEVPYEENRKYQYGVIGWKNMEYAKQYQPKKSICPTKILNKRFNFCTEE